MTTRLPLQEIEADVDDTVADIATTRTNEQRLTQDVIMPLCDELKRMTVEFLSTRDRFPRISGIDYNSLHRDMEAVVIGSHQSVCSRISKVAREMYELENFENLVIPGAKVDRYSITKCEDPMKYWERLVDVRDELKVAGVRKHAEILNGKLLGWKGRENSVRVQKSCIVVAVSAWRTDYSWETGYDRQSQESLLVMLESIGYVASQFGIESNFTPNCCRLAFGDLFEMGAKVKYCENCELVTNKNGVKVRLSFKLMEAVQVFLAEHGFYAPEPS